MTITVAHSSNPQTSDLPPDISALIDAAMARAAGPATPRRPVVPIVDHPVQDAPLGLPHLNVPNRRARVLALDDLVIVGLFVGLLLAAWVILLVGLDLAQAAERTTRTCITQAYDLPSNRPALDRSSCDRLSHQA